MEKNTINYNKQNFILKNHYETNNNYRPKTI